MRKWNIITTFRIWIRDGIFGDYRAPRRSVIVTSRAVCADCGQSPNHCLADDCPSERRR